MTESVLTFTLDVDTFGLPVEAVAEIIDPLAVTPVPHTSSFAPGLVNVRGVVAPLVDLRARLSLPPGGGGPDARMLVLNVMLDGEEAKVVALADSVDTIAFVPDDAVEPVPDLGTNWPRDFVRGVMKRPEDIIALLDVDRIFAPDDVARPDCP